MNADDVKTMPVMDPLANQHTGGSSASRRTIYVDLDGVMADFDAAFPTLFGLDHRLLADDEMWKHINNHPSFFRDLPPMHGAVEFFHSIHHLNPVILTACPKSNYPLAAMQKLQWVREHLSATCLVLPVLGGRHKPLFMHQPGDVLIDDFEANCDAWTAAGGVAIRHAGNWTATHHALSQIEDLSGAAFAKG
ncbi:TPA: 5' nucleotidase, NT5C type [Stenotrophomonas maltophilia]